MDQKQQEMAFNQQMGLPQDAPAAAINAFLQMMTENKGASKNDKLVAEKKKEAEQAIINYMKSHKLGFLQIRDRYLELKTDSKSASLTDELLSQIYVLFHQQGHQNGKSLEEAAVTFVAYTKEMRKRAGETGDKLSIVKKRPMVATLAALRDLGQNMKL